MAETRKNYNTSGSKIITEMKKIQLLCMFGFMAFLLQSQKIDSESFINQMVKNKGIRSIWGIGDNGQIGNKNLPVLIRVIDLDGKVFKKQTYFGDFINYYAYIIVKPDKVNLLNLNTGKFREAFVGRGITKSSKKGQYFFTVILYQYNCSTKYPLGMYSVTIELNKIGKNLEIVNITCCGDAD